MPKNPYVRWFENIRLNDIPKVGGKNASLGELYSMLAAEGIRVPEFRGDGRRVSRCASRGQCRRKVAPAGDLQKPGSFGGFVIR